MPFVCREVGDEEDLPLEDAAFDFTAFVHIPITLFFLTRDLGYT